MGKGKSKKNDVKTPASVAETSADPAAAEAGASQPKSITDLVRSFCTELEEFVDDAHNAVHSGLLEHLQTQVEAGACLAEAKGLDSVINAVQRAKWTLQEILVVLKDDKEHPEPAVIADPNAPCGIHILRHPKGHGKSGDLNSISIQSLANLVTRMAMEMDKPEYTRDAAMLLRLLDSNGLREPDRQFSTKEYKPALEATMKLRKTLDAIQESRRAGPSASAAAEKEAP